MTTTELAGIAHELKFWQGFVKTPRFLNGWVAPIKTPELHQETFDFINSVPNENILDVGSGVVSILHGITPEYSQTWMDPLGSLYELIFDYKKYNLSPPASIPAEHISKENKYDIVHCSNALDHTQSPAVAVEKMLAAVKPGGFLILQGFENEGTFENWQGFHQWDIFISADNELRYQSEGLEADMGILSKKATHLFRKQLDNKYWYIWIQQKQ